MEFQTQVLRSFVKLDDINTRQIGIQEIDSFLRNLDSSDAAEFFKCFTGQQFERRKAASRAALLRCLAVAYRDRLEVIAPFTRRLVRLVMLSLGDSEALVRDASSNVLAACVVYISGREGAQEPLSAIVRQLSDLILDASNRSVSGAAGALAEILLQLHTLDLNATLPFFHMWDTVRAALAQSSDPSAKPSLLRCISSYVTAYGPRVQPHLAAMLACVLVELQNADWTCRKAAVETATVIGQRLLPTGRLGSVHAELVAALSALRHDKVPVVRALIPAALSAFRANHQHQHQHQPPPPPPPPPPHSAAHTPSHAYQSADDFDAATVPLYRDRDRDREQRGSTPATRRASGPRAMSAGLHRPAKSVAAFNQQRRDSTPPSLPFPFGPNMYSNVADAPSEVEPDFDVAPLHARNAYDRPFEIGPSCQLLPNMQMDHFEGKESHSSDETLGNQVLANQLQMVLRNQQSLLSRLSQLEAGHLKFESRLSVIEDSLVALSKRDRSPQKPEAAPSNEQHTHQQRHVPELPEEVEQSAAAAASPTAAAQPQFPRTEAEEEEDLWTTISSRLRQGDASAAVSRLLEVRSSALLRRFLLHTKAPRVCARLARDVLLAFASFLIDAVHAGEVEGDAVSWLAWLLDWHRHTVDQDGEVGLPFPLVQVAFVCLHERSTTLQPPLQGVWLKLTRAYAKLFREMSALEESS